MVHSRLGLQGFLTSYIQSTESDIRLAGVCQAYLCLNDLAVDGLGIVCSSHILDSSKLSSSFIQFS